MRWPWQKEEGGEGRNGARVRVFDFDTQRFSVIPAAELAPGMVAVRMKDVEGEVWVDNSRLKPSALLHPPFSEDVRAQLYQIKNGLDEVYPMSLEQWEDGFRRDRNPEPEIAHWLYLSQVYAGLAAPEAGMGSSLARRQAIFKVLVACGISPKEHILSILDREPLSREEVEQVIAAFYRDREGKFRPALLRE